MSKTTIEEYLATGKKFKAYPRLDNQIGAYDERGNTIDVLIIENGIHGQSYGEKDGELVWQFLHCNDWCDCTGNNPETAIITDKSIRQIFRITPAIDSPNEQKEPKCKNCNDTGVVTEHPSFWKRLDLFLSDIQVSDLPGHEELEFLKGECKKFNQ